MLRPFQHILFILTMSLLCTTQALADQRILRWVDSQGVTHYGDLLPPAAAGKKNVVINKQGVVVKRNNQTAADAEDQQLKKERLEQKRKDTVLLASYTTADEIDLARTRKLERENAIIGALKTQKANEDGALNRSIASAQAFVDKKQVVPDSLKEEIRIGQLQSEEFDEKIEHHQTVLTEINQHYDAEKARFIALKNQTASN